MINLSSVTDNKDVATKEYVDNNIPTKTSDLTNDSDYISSSALVSASTMTFVSWENSETATWENDAAIYPSGGGSDIPSQAGNAGKFLTTDGSDMSWASVTGLSPYTLMNRDMNAEIRLREFAPVVIEELTDGGRGFTFEEYVIHLASYMENGSRKIIQELHAANRLIPELLSVYAVEDVDRGLFFARDTEHADAHAGDRIKLRTMDPYDFERLIADYFRKRGFVHAEVIGRSGDRGVDVLATNINGELELIQCKRYRAGNNVGSTAIQRVDSYMRSRHACKAWVITTSDFTPDGIDEARITNVTIMNGDALLQSLELYYPGQYTL